MRVYVEEGDFSAAFEQFRPCVQSLLDRAAEALTLPANASVSLLLVSSAEIHDINLEQRGVDAPTDVLSFPMLEYAPHERADTIDMSRFSEDIDPTNGELSLGDIVLNLQAVSAQALEYAHSEQREFCFLLLHSLLHLCGYDHMNKKDEDEMMSRAEGILSSLGITRG